MRRIRPCRSALVVTVFVLLTAGVLLSGCGAGSLVRTERADPSSLQGVYDVILYGGRFADDYEAAAFLVPIGGGYTFEVFAPEFDYKVRRNVPAAEAVSMALSAVSFHHNYARTVMSRIVTSSGATAGYEVRPLYQRFSTGQEDVLDIFYSEQGSKITVKVSLKRFFRDQIERDRPALPRGTRR